MDESDIKADEGDNTRDRNNQRDLHSASVRILKCTFICSSAVSADDKKAPVAFLETLTDPTILTDKRDSNPFVARNQAATGVSLAEDEQNKNKRLKFFSGDKNR